MKVMICEENPDKAKVIEDLLNVYKFKVITLTESLNFVKKVQENKPAVVIINEKFTKKPGDIMLNQLQQILLAQKLRLFLSLKKTMLRKY